MQSERSTIDEVKEFYNDEINKLVDNINQLETKNKALNEQIYALNDQLDALKGENEAQFKHFQRSKQSHEASDKGWKDKEQSYNQRILELTESLNRTNNEVSELKNKVKKLEKKNSEQAAKKASEIETLNQRIANQAKIIEKNKSRTFTIFFVGVVLGLVLTALPAFGMVSSAKSDLKESERKVSSLTSRLIEKVDLIDTIVPYGLNVRVNRIYSKYRDGGDTEFSNISTENAGRIFFDYELIPTGLDISDYNGKSIDIVFITSNGNIEKGNYGSEGISYTALITGSKGFFNWGHPNDDIGNFSKGLYAIEFWYSGKLVGEHSFIIS